MRYKVVVHLSNGDEVQAKVTASTEADALQRVKDTAQFQNFSKTSFVTSYEVEEMQDVTEISIQDRYILQPSQEKGWYIVTDKENLFSIRFQEHHYNETAQVKPIKELPVDALKIATLLREIGEWLALNHADIL